MEFSGLTSGIVRFIQRNRLFLFFILVYFAFVTYFFRGTSSLDPDFGWRLKMGEIIINEGVPKTDPFSYTMASFPFVDHSWVFSTLIALTYPIFKNNLLSLALAFAVFTAISVSVKRNDDKDFEHTDGESRYERWLHPMALTVITFFLLFFSVRAQIISWLIFSILNFLLFKKDNYARYKYFIPVIFLIWANLHGGYFLGLFVIAYFVLFRLIVNKKGTWKDIIILLFCIVSTLVTPYKLEGWREVLSSVFDSRLRWTIAEWLPSITFFDMSMVFYIAISTFMVISGRKNIPKIQYFLFLGLLFFGISSRRNMPYFMLYSLPLVIISINNFHSGLGGAEPKKRFSKAFNILRIFSVLLIIFQMYFTFWKNISFREKPVGNTGFYPVDAISYLKKNDIQKEIFSSYGWGGFLIWRLPEKRVFIDGRMPSWEFSPVDPQKESNSAYNDYLKIADGELDFNSVSDKYGIDYVLWPREKESLFRNLEKEIRKTGMLGKKKNDFSLTGYLSTNGWKLIYSDNTAEVYKRFSDERL